MTQNISWTSSDVDDVDTTFNISVVHSQKSCESVEIENDLTFKSPSGCHISAPNDVDVSPNNSSEDSSPVIQSIQSTQTTSISQQTILTSSDSQSQQTDLISKRLKLTHVLTNDAFKSPTAKLTASTPVIDIFSPNSKEPPSSGFTDVMMQSRKNSKLNATLFGHTDVINDVGAAHVLSLSIISIDILQGDEIYMAKCISQDSIDHELIYTVFDGKLFNKRLLSGLAVDAKLKIINWRKFAVILKPLIIINPIYCHIEEKELLSSQCSSELTSSPLLDGKSGELLNYTTSLLEPHKVKTVLCACSCSHADHIGPCERLQTLKTLQDDFFRPIKIKDLLLTDIFPRNPNNPSSVVRNLDFCETKNTMRLLNAEDDGYDGVKNELVAIDGTIANAIDKASYVQSKSRSASAATCHFQPTFSFEVTVIDVSGLLDNSVMTRMFGGCATPQTASDVASFSIYPLLAFCRDDDAIACVVLVRANSDDTRQGATGTARERNTSASVSSRLFAVGDRVVFTDALKCSRVAIDALSAVDDPLSSAFARFGDSSIDFCYTFIVDDASMSVIVLPDDDLGRLNDKDDYDDVTSRTLSKDEGDKETDEEIAVVGVLLGTVERRNGELLLYVGRIRDDVTDSQPQLRRHKSAGSQLTVDCVAVTRLRYVNASVKLAIGRRQALFVVVLQSAVDDDEGDSSQFRFWRGGWVVEADWCPELKWSDDSWFRSHLRIDDLFGEFLRQGVMQVVGGDNDDVDGVGDICDNFCLSSGAVDCPPMRDVLFRVSGVITSVDRRHSSVESTCASCQTEEKCPIDALETRRFICTVCGHLNEMINLNHVGDENKRSDLSRENITLVVTIQCSVDDVVGVDARFMVDVLLKLHPKRAAELITRRTKRARNASGSVGLNVVGLFVDVPFCRFLGITAYSTAPRHPEVMSNQSKDQDVGQCRFTFDELEPFQMH